MKTLSALAQETNDPGSIVSVNNEEYERRLHLAQGFRKMVMKQAWVTWQRLPAHTRSWISVEDMVSDGMWWVATEGLNLWNPTKAGQSTIMYLGVRTFFDKHYESVYLTQKRWEGNTSSLDSLIADAAGNQQAFSVLNRSLRESASREESVIKDCYVVGMVGGIYREGSKKLQNDIKKWFLGGIDRLRLNSPAFAASVAEFRDLAKPRNLQYVECRHLLRSPLCLDRLAKEILLIPYGGERPTVEACYG